MMETSVGDKILMDGGVSVGDGISMGDGVLMSSGVPVGDGVPLCDGGTSMSDEDLNG